MSDKQEFVWRVKHRNAATCTPLPKSSLIEMAVLSEGQCVFRSAVCGAERRKLDPGLAAWVSRSSPGDQRNDGCLSQVTLTSACVKRDQIQTDTPLTSVGVVNTWLVRRPETADNVASSPAIPYF